MERETRASDKLHDPPLFVKNSLTTNKQTSKNNITSPFLGNKRRRTSRAADNLSYSCLNHTHKRNPNKVSDFVEVFSVVLFQIEKKRATLYLLQAITPAILSFYTFLQKIFFFFQQMACITASGSNFEDHFPLEIHFGEVVEWLQDRAQMLKRANPSLFATALNDLAPNFIAAAKVTVPRLKKAVAASRSAVAEAKRRLSELDIKIRDAEVRLRQQLSRCGVSALEMETINDANQRDIVQRGIEKESTLFQQRILGAVLSPSSPSASAADSSGINNKLTRAVQEFINATDSATAQALLPQLLSLSSSSSCHLVTDRINHAQGREELLDEAHALRGFHVERDFIIRGASAASTCSDAVSVVTELVSALQHAQQYQHEVAGRLDSVLATVNSIRAAKCRHLAANEEWARKLTTAQGELNSVSPLFESARGAMVNTLAVELCAAIKQLAGGRREIHLVGDWLDQCVPGSRR